MTLPQSTFWSGKRVLVTGHTGFKGSWLVLWLKALGAEVSGISLPHSDSTSLFHCASVGDLVDSHYCDIRNLEHLKSVIVALQPELVFHLAAQSLVRPSYADPVSTFAVNVQGTVNVLEGCRASNSCKAIVAVTTDKVYRNNEWCYPYREIDALGGRDPYSASKAASELIIASYRDSFLSEEGIAISSARAGNVIAGGDWSVDRIIPDAVRAWSEGETLRVRSPDSTRPWQHVLDPLSGYIKLAEALYAGTVLPDAFNFGPQNSGVASVKSVIELARGLFNGFATSVEYSSAEPVSGLHEARALSLDSSKVNELLGISPRWCLEEAIEKTMAWYAAFYSGADPLTLCQNDLISFGEEQ